MNSYFVLIIPIALIIDLLVGDPFGMVHPIVLVGKLISFIRKKLGKPNKIKGFILLFLVLFISIGSVNLLLFVISKISMSIYYGLCLYFIYALMATGCMGTECKRIQGYLELSDIDNARKYTGYLVSRDTSIMEEKDLIRSVVETTSENTIDGALAPLFYCIIGAILGYPVEFILGYKVINTLDSMVGYITEPYKEIGYASAKLDDIVNFIPARIGSIFMFLAGIVFGYDYKQGFNTFLKDRKKHKSPNSAHPESVVAGLLNIKIGGNDVYFDKVVEKPYINEMGNTVQLDDIRKTFKIMAGSEMILALIGIIIMGVLI